ncbi:MAG: hypothetical protein J0H68_05895 [Sphingobacteriia bacterium]|nr:hypothetical protein [Sphingobacteriia bacterium]
MFKKFAVKFIGYIFIFTLIISSIEFLSKTFYEDVTIESGRKSVDIIVGKEYPTNFLAYLPHPYCLYINNPNWEAGGFKQNNSLGYRGKEFSLIKPKGVIRILALGGSTTYNFPSVLNPEDAWPVQLEKLLKEQTNLNIEVINGGLNAGTSGEVLSQYIFKHRYIKPDIVIYNAGWNDAATLIFSKYEPDYASYRKWGGLPINARPGEQALLKHSYFAKIFYSWWLKTPKVSNLLLFPSEWDEITSDKAIANVKKHEPVGFARNLELVLRNIKQDGAIPIIMAEQVAPVEILKTNNDPWAIKAFPALLLAFDKVKRDIKLITTEENVLLFQMPDNSIPLQYFTDHAHVNKDGDRVKAEFLAKNLLPYLKNWYK